MSESDHNYFFGQHLAMPWKEKKMNTRQPYAIRSSLRKISALYKEKSNGEFEVTTGLKGAITGTLNRLLAEDNHRRIVLSWLFFYNEQENKPFVEKSSKELSDGDWYAVHNWMDSWYDEDEATWIISETFKVEIAGVLVAALNQYNSEVHARDELFDDDEYLAQEVLKVGGVLKKITPHGFIVDFPEDSILGQTRYGKIKKK